MHYRMFEGEFNLLLQILRYPMEESSSANDSPMKIRMTNKTEVNRSQVSKYAGYSMDYILF